MNRSSFFFRAAKLLLSFDREAQVLHNKNEQLKIKKKGSRSLGVAKLGVAKLVAKLGVAKLERKEEDRFCSLYSKI